jgi:hypothetical protein
MRSRNICSKKRAGYTLFEMVMVQALLVGMVAASWPALRSPMGKSQLVDAAKQLRVALIKARHKAIETGVAQQFRYQPGSTVYEIVAAGKAKSSKDELARNNESADPKAEEEAVHELPSEIQFSETVAKSEKESDSEVPAVTDSRSSAGMPWSVGDEEWSSPVVFHPNGRTSNAKIALRGTSNFEIEVSLRGLTGIASIGEAHRVDEAKR